MLNIITDSSAEFSEEEAKALGLRIIPLTVIFDGTAYLEGVDLEKDKFYERLLAGEFPHTSQPSTEQFREAFEATNGEETLVLLISSALSGTINAAEVAKRDGNFENVHIYDSLCTTAMLRILVETAIKNRTKSAAEVIAILDELRPRIRLHACLDTLEFLYKGGRIKKSVAILGGLLGIKPLIEITKEGTVGMCGKAHGQKKALRSLIDVLKSEALDKNYPVYFLQTDTDKPTREVMAGTGHEDDRIFRICCAVGTHIGPNAAGLVYVVK
ncbi:MAG: DegV family protein [Clostridiales bacterium]|nr:DegV family protein [Clostridiales bacterium]